MFAAILSFLRPAPRRRNHVRTVTDLRNGEVRRVNVRTRTYRVLTPRIGA